MSGQSMHVNPSSVEKQVHEDEELLDPTQRNRLALLRLAKPLVPSGIGRGPAVQEIVFLADWLATGSTLPVDMTAEGLVGVVQPAPDGEIHTIN